MGQLPTSVQKGKTAVVLSSRIHRGQIYPRWRLSYLCVSRPRTSSQCATHPVWTRPQRQSFQDLISLSGDRQPVGRKDEDAAVEANDPISHQESFTRRRRTKANKRLFLQPAANRYKNIIAIFDGEKVWMSLPFAVQKATEIMCTLTEPTHLPHHTLNRPHTHQTAGTLTTQNTKQHTHQNTHSPTTQSLSHTCTNHTLTKPHTRHTTHPLFITHSKSTPSFTKRRQSIKSLTGQHSPPSPQP